MSEADRDRLKKVDHGGHKDHLKSGFSAPKEQKRGYEEYIKNRDGDEDEEDLAQGLPNKLPKIRGRNNDE